MKRTPLLASFAVIAAAALTGCGGGDETLDPESEDGGGGGEIVVGSANFPESVLLGEIYTGALKEAGLEVSHKANIGSRETYLPGMQDGSLQVFPEYTGVLRDYYAKEAGDTDMTASDPDGVYDELKSVLPEDLTVLEFSDAQDKDAVVVTAATAERYGLESIGDLAPVAGDLALGGPPEWKTRATGLPGLEKVYGVEFGEFTVTDTGGPLTLKALLDDRVQAGNLFTTNPSIADENLVVLEDPDSLFAAQNVVPLVATDALNPTIEATLNKVSSELSTPILGDMVTQVVVDKEDPEVVAKEFLDGLDN